MKTQTVINICFLVLILIVGGLSLRHEPTTQTEPINLELYKYKFEEINTRFDVLESEDLRQDTVINSIKYQIVTDEKVIRNASNSDVDSIFNTMVARQRKSSVR